MGKWKQFSTIIFGLFMMLHNSSSLARTTVQFDSVNALEHIGQFASKFLFSKDNVDFYYAKTSSEDLNGNYIAVHVVADNEPILDIKYIYNGDEISGYQYSSEFIQYYSKIAAKLISLIPNPYNRYYGGQDAPVIKINHYVENARLYNHPETLSVRDGIRYLPVSSTTFNYNYGVDGIFYNYVFGKKGLVGGPFATEDRFEMSSGQGNTVNEAIASRIKLNKKLIAKQKQREDAPKNLLMSAEQGNPSSQYTLGEAYRDGRYKFKVDLQKAWKWMLKSANQGHGLAQANLGTWYYWGSMGVRRDYSKSEEWFTKAANQGHPLSRKMLKEVKRKLQKNEARDKVTEDVINMKASNPDFKSCYDKIDSRLTTCHVSIGECDIVGCQNDATCDRGDGRVFGIHPCERELNISASSLGTFYCDVETLKHSEYKDDIILNECR